MLWPDAAFFGFCEPLIDFINVFSISLDRFFLWENHWNQLDWAYSLGGVGSQGNTKRWANSASQVVGNSNILAACICKVQVGRAQQ